MLGSREINKRTVADVFEAALDIECINCLHKCDEVIRLQIAIAVLKQSGFKVKISLPQMSDDELDLSA